ncbi:MAG: M20 family metallo-hydrolase [Ichthyobacteriaceae bacterium]|nr:M20 family metallo-hydrolase [Ichthyobacteriaceae bacterium]
MKIETLQYNAVELLKKLIATPSISGDEKITGDILVSFLKENGVENINRQDNNIWALNKFYDKSKPTVLLNSHHDTVKPNSGYTRDPFSPDIEDGILYGLGSNDAGGPAVSLLSTFLYFYNNANLKYNVMVAISAEEENSGPNCIVSLLPNLPDFEFAIVGEPTQMQMAVAEKGLMVLEGFAPGKAGHAAREEGENAIYNAMKDIAWFQSYQFDKESNVLGKVKMSVTQIEAGKQHNVVPDTCKYVVDVRNTEEYTNQEVYDIINENTVSRIHPRSMRFNPSFISKNHPIVLAGTKLGRTMYGSPTQSDQAFIKQPSLKMGPGDSARSHTANEYIHISEINEGIELYINILSDVIV